MARPEPGQRPPKLEPRESTIHASGHFVFQIVGNLLAIVAVWLALVGILGITGSLGRGWQGHVVGAVVLVAGVGLFRLGQKLALDNQAMRLRR